VGQCFESRGYFCILHASPGRASQRFGSSPTGMFALPDPVSHVNSAAFAQARLRYAHPVYVGDAIKYASRQKSLTFNERPESSLPNL
jgi:hypothetical protein